MKFSFYCRFGGDNITEEQKKKKMKQDLFEIGKTLFVIVSILITSVAAISIFIYRFKNPQLTETEIMIYSTTKYWWSYLMLTISAFIVYK